MNNPLDDPEEKKSFLRILAAFKYYKNYSLAKVKQNEKYLDSLPEKHQLLLVKYKNHLSDLKLCIDKNYEIIKLIIKDVDFMFENVPSSEPVTKLISPLPNNTDLEKVQTTLKQFVRDWSEEGKEERKTCYEPIINEIQERFSSKNKVDPKDIKILVPGAGLGRLAFEIARRGYVCQGNEFSMFMLFASNFILNKCHEKNFYSIYPWVQQTDNNIETHHQTIAVRFPDINTKEFEHCDFSMAAGDFLQVYVNPDEWNCVATCFFIDCANNIVSFIETIYNILKPGGIWINLGPLLYHYSNMMTEDSIEPSYEVVREVILGIGFTFEKEELNVATKYAQNPYSMLQYEYKSVYFVCRKPHRDDLNGLGNHV